MVYHNGKVAGALLFVAAAQFVLGLIVSEALYSSYSVSANYISDLGVGSSSMIFNSSVFLLGLLLVIGAYFLQRAFDFKMLTVILVLAAVGAMGVGIFTEDFGAIHVVVSLIAFLFGGLTAIFTGVCSYVHENKLLKMPFSFMAIILGLMTLGALILFGGKVYLGLGAGGMERMILYPILIWGIGFGGYLMAHNEEQATQQKSQQPATRTVACLKPNESISIARA
jgi:hypothetical membrane protein